MTSGWIILDKPSGISSRAAGGRVARMFGVKKFGHLGTLDPMASGVLPIALGEATKMVPYLESSNNDKTAIGLCTLNFEHYEKEYLFRIKWGVRTDTDDITGRVLEQNDSVPTDVQIQDACRVLIGEVWQTPPAYSAVHINGRRAYELARRGEQIEIPRRQVKIYDLKYLDNKEFLVRCGTGTYVRSLAQQIAEKCSKFKVQSSNNDKPSIELCTLNFEHYICTVDMIRRTFDNGFNIKDAHPLDFLENLYNNDPAEVQKYLCPVDFGLDDILVLELDDNDARSFKNGGFIKSEINNSDIVRVYSDGIFVGVGTVTDGLLKPERVINT